MSLMPSASLLDPLEAGTSPLSALITIGFTGTRFEERAAQAEEFARSLSVLSFEAKTQC